MLDRTADGVRVALTMRIGLWWRRLGGRPVGSLLLVGAATMACGIVLRLDIFGYHGAPIQGPFNRVLFAHLGSYSDIASLYFRDHIWLHRLPYVAYRFEYPVGIGMFAWLTGLSGGGVAGYLAVNAVALVACGLLTLWLLCRLPRANPWLLAVAPALALYVVLNWDLLSLAALLVALALFARGRDGWCAVALGVATWTKFFPIIALPVMLWVRLLDGCGLRARVRALARLLVPFTVATSVINAPFAFHPLARGGPALSSNWLWFFHFNAARGPAASLWSLLTHDHMPAATANAYSGVVTFLGVALACGALRWVRRRDALAPERVILAILIAFASFFFAIKLYMPQYDLWVIVLLAAAGAPVALAVSFAAADLWFFAAAFTHGYSGPANHWFVANVLKPSEALREGVLLAIVAWALFSIVSDSSTHRRRESNGIRSRLRASTSDQSRF